MSVTDPAPFLEDLDVEFLLEYKNAPARTSRSSTEIKYVEPHLGALALLAKHVPPRLASQNVEERSPDAEKIRSKVVVLEDFIDTDAV